uniref:Structural protein n=1 Tax=Strongyloides venezuelensis TaxID=75913 RepID=A0A0K0FFW1_STRVS
MPPDNKNKDNLKNPPGGKSIENVEDQVSDSDGWVPADFEIQLVGRGYQTYSEDDIVQDDDANFSYSDNSSESSWPDTDDEYQEEIVEEYFDGYKSIPLIVEESKPEDAKDEGQENVESKIDSSVTSMTISAIINSVKKETENVHLAAKDFDYTPVGKRELVLDDEKISKIKDVMKKINITPPPWATKIDDNKLSELVKEIIR